MGGTGAQAGRPRKEPKEGVFAVRGAVLVRLC